MDFMRILDQTVREIKREVNLKVLKVPEIEQKVLDATSDEAWGPHGSTLSEIAQSTKKFTECQIIMSVLWIRLTETDANWRHVYKALAVVEYLVANGSERALDEILDRSHRIAALSDFQRVDTNGKDVGINVRKKVETILALLSDKEKINQVREKAASNRDKYFGLSSTGITYKSTSGSQGGISIDHNDGYRGVRSEKGDTSKGSYKTRARHEGDSEKALENRESPEISQKTKSKKGVRHHARTTDSQQSSSSKSMVTPVTAPPPSVNTQSNTSQDDFDDFDPRGTSAGRADLNTVDLFGQSVVADLMDLPPPCPVEAINMKSGPEVDLFANVTFLSASATAGSGATPQTQGHVDMFANKPDSPPAMDFFATSKPGLNSETKSSDPEPTNNENFDPFAAIPLNNFEQSDQFGNFTSNATSASNQPTRDTSGSSQLQASGQTASSIAKKDTFHVKSTIWADSLSRGLIDLNITAPKMTSLADIGILGGLDEGSHEKNKVLPTSTFMSGVMGPGSGWNTAGFSSSSMVTGNGQATSGLGQHQFRSFK